MAPEERNFRRQQGYGDPLEPRRRAGWGWFWLMMVIIICGLWFGGWGWGGYGGWWWGHGRNNNFARGTASPGPGAGVAAPNAAAPGPAIAQPASGSGVAVLDANNKAPYIGKNFNLQDATVQRDVNDHTFWVATQNAPAMLLVVTGNTINVANQHISDGDRIDVSGIVEKAPPSSAQAQQDLKLNHADSLEVVGQQRAYLQANANQLQKVQG